MSDQTFPRSKRRLRVRLAALIFLGAIACSALVSADSEIPSAQAAPLEKIVAHPSVPMTRVELATLRALFGMRLLEWPDGTPVRVFVMDSDSETHRRFTKEVRQAWDRLIFSGTGQAPSEVESIGEMVRQIIETPGAIGYLPADELVEGISELEVAEQ